MKATRDALGDTLPTLFKENPKLIAIDPDLGKATRLAVLKTQFPKQYISAGIAEANAIGVAAGLSQHGFIPIVASFGAFLTGRYDTIRCSIAYPNCPVLLIGTHGGMAIGKDGVTQMGLEDIALMRALPNFTVLNPATYKEACELIPHVLANMTGPVYLRLARQPTKDIDLKDVYVSKRKANTKQTLNIYSTGPILETVIDVVKYLIEVGFSVNVENVTSLKPFKAHIYPYGLNISIEDHSIIGGLGDALLSAMNNTPLHEPLLKIGIQDVFPESGSPEDLYAKYGLDKQSIIDKILTYVHTR